MAPTVDLPSCRGGIITVCLLKLLRTSRHLLHLLRVKATLHIHHLHLLCHHLSGLRVIHADLIYHLHHLSRVHHLLLNLLLHSDLLRVKSLLRHPRNGAWASGEHRPDLLLVRLHTHARLHRHVRPHSESLSVSVHHLCLLHVHSILHSWIREATHLTRHSLF